jgi:hypothetical protein
MAHSQMYCATSTGVKKAPRALRSSGVSSKTMGEAAASKASG